MENNAVATSEGQNLVFFDGQASRTITDTLLESPHQPQVTVNLSPTDHLDFLHWQAHKRDRHVEAQIKSYEKIFEARRNTLVLRRVDCKQIANDEDVLAYIKIYELKEAVSEAGKKILITDSEIRAYRVLDPDFNGGITISEITAKLKEHDNQPQSNTSTAE